MTKQTVTVTDAEGLHLRPAGLLSKIARNFTCETTIIYNGIEINAKKMMAIMSAGITAGAEIEIACDGENEAVALSDMVAFFG